MTQRMSIKSLSHELKLVPEETQATHHDLLDIKKDFNDLYEVYKDTKSIIEELGIKKFEDEIKGIIKKLKYD